MLRLSHSYAGHLRLMQMSNTQLYIFVEGKQCDPYFYGQICEATIGSEIPYDIAEARQLPGDAGGKKKLLDFFTYLRKRNALITSVGMRKTTCIFFLDKDVDDLQKKRKRSSHVVYTRHYDVQNYVYEHGDLVIGSASAASIDPRRLRPDLQDSAAWCRRIADNWKDWLALCLYIMNEGPACEANYRVASRLQSRLCEPTDPAALQLFTTSIARRAGVPVSDLRNRLSLYRNRVDRHLSRGSHHKVFKGKWFGEALADDIDRLMAGNPYDSNGLSKRLPSAVASTLDFSGVWADDLKRPLRSVVSML